MAENLELTPDELKLCCDALFHVIAEDDSEEETMRALLALHHKLAMHILPRGLYKMVASAMYGRYGRNRCATCDGGGCGDCVDR
jgi:hypothetical protein